MTTFSEILTATDAELTRLFARFEPDPKDDFIARINKIAAQLDLNHSQLICGLGFNKHTRDLTDIHSRLGFRSYKLLAYRCHELFITDIYRQLSIDNLLDIYSEHIQDKEVDHILREKIDPRLGNVEAAIESKGDPSHVISYRMEIHSIYSAGIADKAFAESRLKKDIGKFRLMASEIKIIIDAGYFPPSNLFFMDSLSVEEKKELIESKHINHDMIKNRLQNSKISPAERDLLEEYI